MNRFGRQLQCAIAFVIAGVSLTACASDQFSAVKANDAAARSLAAQTTSTTEYRLTTGDRIRVNVFGATTVSGEYTVDNAGAISLSPVGQLQIKDLTTADAAMLIGERLKESDLYRAPRVTVDVVSFGPFYILGEVNKPGEISYRPGMSLFAAVASAGGYTYRANTRNVYIRKPGEPVESEYDLQSDIAVLPGDVIRVPELRF
jgi:polysaccharide export outer membrane protein